MKWNKTKPVSTDDLAIMIAKGFSEVDRKFDGVDKKFDSVDKKFENLENKLTQKIDGLGNRIDHLADSKVSWNGHKKLEDRVVRLEESLD